MGDFAPGNVKLHRQNLIVLVRGSLIASTEIS
jgi:hypothetical protein